MARVSIIMPMYNAESYISETIDSVLSQSYADWELIIVDDCSTDNSYDIAREYASKDERIKLLKNECNMGAAKARNIAIYNASGRYVAYLDADDLWMPLKLEKQVVFAEANKCGMCFTSYETIEEDGKHRNYISVPESISYTEFLKNTITCSDTALIDLNLVSKELLICPDYSSDFDIPEDLIVWLQVLKTGVIARGLNEILAKYRKHPSSRSSNMLNAVSRTWNAYRKVERLGIFASLHCLIWQLYHALLKRL